MSETELCRRSAWDIPDSRRFWLSDTYHARFAAGEPPDTLDKDFIRRRVSERCDPYQDAIPTIPPTIPQDVLVEAAGRYVDLYEQLTGEGLELPDVTVPPLARIRANLKSYVQRAH